MKLEQILNYIINALFFFMGDKLKGFRTIIVNTVTLLIGLWEFLSGGNGLFEFLCNVGQTFEPFAFFCTISEGAFYAIAITIVGALNNVLRLLTANAVGVSTTPQELRYEFNKPTTGQTTARAIAGGSIGVILFMFLKALIGF